MSISVTNPRFSSPTPVPSSPSPDPYEDCVHFTEVLGDGVIFLDPGWRITYANDAARAISRILPEHINGPSHWELYPATIGTDQERIYRRSMDERVSLVHEFYYPPFSVWISLRTYPIPSGIAVHYRDITRLKEAEAHRDITARRLEQVFETTTDAIIVLDSGYRLTFLNRCAQELLAPFGDILGKSLFQAFPAVVYQDSPYVATYRRAMEDRISGCFEAFYPEPLNVWFSVEARPTENDGGGIIIFFRDITEQRAAAQELQTRIAETERQAAEMEAVYRTAPIGLALFDTEDFRYLRLNNRQAAFFGLKPEEVVGRTLTEMAPIPGLRELFEQVRDGQPVINYPLEGELISHPGEHRYWTVNYFPVYAPDGTVQAISAASLEVTAQKKAETALIQSEKLAAVGRLASSISHEINNPLESITNLLYLIASRDDLSPQVREYVDIAQGEITRVSQIATQTLRFHRQSARSTLITAEQLFASVLNLFRGRLLNSGIDLETRFDSSTPILCLENEIRQVLSNLVANAIDAMRVGGRLHLRAHDAHDSLTGVPGLRIVVADTGHGMSSATMARIFEPFFTTKDLNGTGLGLWISSEILHRHHGRLNVRSSQHPLHHGTVFILFLPCASSPA